MTEDAPDGPDRPSAESGADLPPDLALPRYIARQDDGLWVDLGFFSEAAAFRDWVDRLFTRGLHLRELDYRAFLRLAFDFEPGVVADEIRACEPAGRPARLRLAAGLAHIVGARIPLYRAVKISGGNAEYLFEPVTIEFTISQPVYEADDHGGQRLLRTDSVVVAQKTRLDFDEFVAQMWLKGVRFGLDEAGVRRAIADDFTGRLTIARGVPAGAGHDAAVEEVAEGLRRDDAPGLTPDGKLNLARFRNRFPQVRAGARLLRKAPLELGTPGREVSGRALPPPVPRDLDFGALAGPGTRVEQDAGTEYLVATMDGFLDIDHDTNKVSVADKVINRAGVSLRTTGDISLMGEEYEEHGEIQEGRVVEGFNITACADVFGKLVSTGGTITITKNLSGGLAVNHGGRIVVEGRASGATILAPGCEVSVRQAEGSIIVARRVVIGERAAGCDIHADEVDIARADGCTIGAAAVVIATAGSHAHSETLVSVLLPALAEHEAGIAGARERLVGIDAADVEAKRDADALRGQPELANYLAIAGRIRRQELHLTDAQKPAFEKLGQRAAPALKELARLAGLAKARDAEREALAARIAKSEAACESVRAAVSCRIGEVVGDVIVRALPPPPGGVPLASLSPVELKAFLRATPPGSRLLFSGDSGQFEWRLAPLADSPPAPLSS